MKTGENIKRETEPTREARKVVGGGCSNRQRILNSFCKGLMIIAADSTPCLCLGLFFVRAVSGKPISTVGIEEFQRAIR